MIAKVCDRASRRDTWFENRLVIVKIIINNATYQRETLSERPIRQPLKGRPGLSLFMCFV